MSALKDLTGQRFGRLTVISRAENKGRRTCWRCHCDCGNDVVVIAENLGKNVNSCGCLNCELTVQRLTKHGMAHTKIYHIWCGMMQRCNNPNNLGYPNYGGREIKVCERWFDFQNFYDDVSKLEHFGEEGYTLDRIDNNGNYEPGNVRWANSKTQARNKRNSVGVKIEGVKVSLAQISETTGISYATLYARNKNGDCEDRLLRLVGGAKKNFKLNVEKANQIREFWATGEYKQRQLAKMFGVSQSTIEDIVNNRTWN